MMDVDMLNVDYRKYKLPEYVYDPHSYGAPWKEGQDRLFKMNTIGLGRRHNVQHWGNGVGDTRHTWNGGIMMYYYATGNRRAYDAVIAMAEMHMQRIWGYAAGEYTLSLWCLYNAWQMTGDARYLDELKYRIGRGPQAAPAGRRHPGASRFRQEVGLSRHRRGRRRREPCARLHLERAHRLHRGHGQYEGAGGELLAGALREERQRKAWPGKAYNSVDYIRPFAWAYLETKEERYLDRLKFLVDSMSTEPLHGTPTTEEEWVKATWKVLWSQAWQIRHIGPGVRMMPWGLAALQEAEKK